MQPTSRIAYNKRELSGENESDKEAVLRALTKIGHGTKEDIARVLKWPQEKVHKRLSQILQEGKIFQTELKKVAASTGHLQIIWAVKGIKEIKVKVN